MSPIKDLQLSRNTVTRRFERMETLQLCWREIGSLECYLLQFDESTDSVVMAQLCTFIRIVFEEMTTKRSPLHAAS